MKGAYTRYNLMITPRAPRLAQDVGVVSFARAKSGLGNGGKCKVLQIYYVRICFLSCMLGRRTEFDLWVNTRIHLLTKCCDERKEEVSWNCTVLHWSYGFTIWERPPGWILMGHVIIEHSHQHGTCVHWQASLHPTLLKWSDCWLVLVLAKYPL